jgi:hypothetical protein
MSDLEYNSTVHGFCVFAAWQDVNRRCGLKVKQLLHRHMGHVDMRSCLQEARRAASYCCNL